MTDYIGRTLNDRYDVEEIIGKGGMGSVYRGRHTIIGRKVAIKFLHAEFTRSEDVVTRFYREAQAAAAIGHKGIIDVLDVGVSDTDEPYLVMEYLEGESLSALIKRSRAIGLAAACGILEPALQALSAAHDKGIFHRDLKPDNIFLVHDKEDDVIRVKLIDFGISKFSKAQDQAMLTQAGATLGTPAYMSPEQARGSLDIDHRTDIYSMGVIFFEMLSGEMPFVGNNNNDLLIKILTEVPRKGLEVHPEFPEEAQPVIDVALSRLPSDRYSSCSEMLEALKNLTSFAERHTQLTQYASGITERNAALGDLGGKLVSSKGSSVPQRVLSKVSREGTPGEWTGKSNIQESLSPAAAKKIKMLTIAIGGLVLLLIIVVILIVQTDKQDKSVQKPPASLPKPLQKNDSKSVDPAQVPIAPLKKTVDISVTGIPLTASIYLGYQKMASNPFPVAYGTSPVTIRVEAPGYKAQELTVVPSEDRALGVVLEKVATAVSEQQKTTASQSSASKRDKPKKGKKSKALTSKSAPSSGSLKTEKTGTEEKEPPKKKNAAKETLRKYRKGRRGTEIAEEFE